MEQQFDFKAKYKIIFIILIVVGIAAVIAGCLCDPPPRVRCWVSVGPGALRRALV